MQNVYTFCVYYEMHMVWYLRAITVRVIVMAYRIEN